MRVQRNDRPQSRTTKIGAALLATAVLASCGGAAALVVPFFTFGFGFTGNVGGAQHTVSLSLSPNEPTTSSGAFDAIGSNISIDGAQSDLTGSYSECAMTINVPTAAPPLATAYRGRFTSKDVIELTPTSPAPSATVPVLTLNRSNGGTDTRADTC